MHTSLPRLTVFLALAGVVSCAATLAAPHTPLSVFPAAPNGVTEISLQRAQGRSGLGPDYRVTVFRGRDAEYVGNAGVVRIGRYTAPLDTTRFDSLATLLLTRPWLAFTDSTDEGRGWQQIPRLTDCDYATYGRIWVVIRGHVRSVTDRCGDSLFIAEYLAPVERVAESLPWTTGGWLTTAPRTIEHQFRLPPGSVEYYTTTMRWRDTDSTDLRPDFTAVFREPAVEVLGYHRGTMDFDRLVRRVAATIPKERVFRQLSLDLCEGGEHCIAHPYDLDSLRSAIGR